MLCEICDQEQFPIDNDVRAYLIKIEQQQIIYNIQDNVQALLQEIKDLKQLYDKGGRRFAGPDLLAGLLHNYYLLYNYVNGSYLVYHNFSRYKNLTSKIFEGLVICRNIPEYNSFTFSEFILTEVILHVHQTDLNKTFKNVKHLKTSNKVTSQLLEKLSRFLSSFYEDNNFSAPYIKKPIRGKLDNFDFKNTYTNIFANFFIILSKLEITKEQFSGLTQSIIKFIKAQKKSELLAWFQLKELGKFILKKGSLFNPNEILSILTIAIEGQEPNKTTYDEFIKIVSQALAEFYPDFKITDELLIEKVLVNSTSTPFRNSNFTNIVYLANVCNGQCRQILLETFEKVLDIDFSEYFYEILIWEIGYSIDEKDYFKQYSEIINRDKKFENYGIFGNPKLTNWLFMRYVFIFYRCSFDFTRPELQSFTDLNDFETWILSPYEFDYTKFDAKWLIELNNTIIVEKLEGYSDIKIAIENELQNEFHPVLAELKYKHFN